MLADLHLHSQYSDGTLTPRQLAAKAKATGIGLIAVCDHNTLAAYPHLQRACDELGLSCIRGVEIEADFDDTSIHILAYNVDADNAPLLALLENNQEIMERMSIDLIDRMSADYAALSPDDYATYVRDPQYGGWKGVDYLRSKGFDISYPHCMNHYRQYHISPYRTFERVGAICDVIHGAGGVAILAHPDVWFTAEEVADKLAVLYAHGIDGVECYYTSHSAAYSAICTDFCRTHDLLITAGSDDHGEFAKYIDGFVYGMGAVMIDTDQLNLKGLV